MPKTTTVKLSTELRNQMKSVAAMKGIPLQVLVHDALEKYVGSHLTQSLEDSDQEAA